MTAKELAAILLTVADRADRYSNVDMWVDPEESLALREAAAKLLNAAPDQPAGDE